MPVGKGFAADRRPGSSPFVSLQEEDMELAKKVSSTNVGRLAERIVANELEWREFKVSDLNKDGLSPNADLVAAKGGKTWQVQVKGATNKSDKWWIEYGFCTDEIIERRAPMFNRRQSFYKADIVVLVAVRSPRDYRCIVLTAADAERAANINLDRDYRTLTRKGEKKKPHKVWVLLQRDTHRALPDAYSPLF
jgi:hypothetical protein